MVRRLAFLAATLVFAAAGCGGDDEPSTDEFISEAKKICAAAQDKRDAQEAAADGSQQEPFEENPVLLQQDNEVGRDAVAKLKALDAPEDERAGLQKLIGAAERGVAATDDLIAALKANDRKAQESAFDKRELAQDDVGAAAGATEMAGCEAL